MRVDHLDHLVLTVADVEASCAFYARVLGMRPPTFGEGRRALAFGTQKINLHPAGREYLPKAVRPTPGSADLCFITALPLPLPLPLAQAQAQAELVAAGAAIEDGPLQRTGATGPLRCIPAVRTATRSRSATCCEADMPGAGMTFRTGGCHRSAACWAMAPGAPDPPARRPT